MKNSCIYIKTKSTRGWPWPVLAWPWPTFHRDPGRGEDFSMLVDCLTFDLPSILHIELADEEGRKLIMVGHVVLPAVSQFLSLQVPTGQTQGHTISVPPNT